MEFSFVLPCLNESASLAYCIGQIREGAEKAGIVSYEVIVADNGSEDGSQEIARNEGAQVIDVTPRGYGAALNAGITGARGKYVIMGDSDASYDFSDIAGFVDALRAGKLLVVGSRLRGEIKRGAMPTFHRWLGNPILTRLANLFFGTGLSDYHCGLRAFEREAILSLDLQTTGMEYASEMIIRAALLGIPMVEVPITYYPDQRGRAPHLRTWRDGWRHLRFLLLFSPDWVFLYPGFVLMIAGLGFSLILLAGPIELGSITFDVHTLLFSATMLVLGTQLVLMAILTKAYASHTGLLPGSRRLTSALDAFSLEVGLAAGLVVILLGFAMYGIGFYQWSQIEFGEISNYASTLRLSIAGTTLVAVGGLLFFGSFVVSLLGFQDETQ
ncbi:MAG: glycosyltransferase family 2 protein [Anaerolineales bacterium]